MAEPFLIRFTVRSYEVDMNGHLTGATYVQWADQVRFECGRAAGARLWSGPGIEFGPINLETTIRYHRELRLADEVNVSCAFVWGDGKTFRVEHEFRRADDETLAAEVASVCGMLDLKERRLLPDPKAQWRTMIDVPELLNLG